MNTSCHCAILASAVYLFVALSSAYAQVPVPEDGKYVGVGLGGQMSLQEFNSKTGVQHSMVVQFFNFPRVVRDPYVRDDLEAFLQEAREGYAVPLVTLETYEGLQSFSRTDISTLASILRSHPGGVLVRWNHEMNGSWYPWGQQPDLYKAKFREVASVLHSETSNVAMAWVPNIGDGYPWDGTLVGGTDPYAGYYPGDAYVDWVGLSIYHYGWNGRSIGNNVYPAEDDFEGKIRGWTNRITDFYEEYAVRRNKPMVIAETSALFRASQNGVSETEIKSAWINQVYKRWLLPKVKAICWFNIHKYKPDFNDWIDWRVSANSTVASKYSSRFSSKRWLTRGERALFKTPPPRQVSLGQRLSLPVYYRAKTTRSIQLIVLEVKSDGRWVTKDMQSVDVGAGSGTRTLSVSTPTWANSASSYLLQLRIIPRGGKWYDRIHYDLSPISIKGS